MLLGEYFKQRREANGLSQKDVATYMGYKTAQFISNWERNISYPPLKDLKKVCKLIGADVRFVSDMMLTLKIKELTESFKKELGK